MLGEEPHVDPDLETTLRGFFSRRGYAMPERNVKQCWLIPSARAIPNPRGTAPGWWVERDGKLIVAMPGPPSEMHRMWEQEVAPELVRRHPGAVLITRTLKTTGIGEGNVDEMVSPLLKSTNPSIGIYARADGVQLRIAAKADTADQARELIAPVEEEARRILGPAVWGADEDTFESVVGDMMRVHDVTVATMESCTGGLLASTLTDVPGASIYFKGGFISYQTELKVEWGVPQEVVDEFGVISPECARAMAKAARDQLETSVGIGITGVAGPDEQEGKPVGTIHIGIDAIWNAPQTMSYVFPQDRMAIKRRAVTVALGLLRQQLLGYRPEALV